MEYQEIPGFENIPGIVSVKKVVLDTKEFVNDKFSHLNAKQRRRTTQEINKELKTNPDYLEDLKDIKKRDLHDIPYFGGRIFTNLFPKGYYKGQKASGYPFNKDLKKNLEIVKDTVLNHNDDFLMVLDGPVSLGKSTLSFQIALFLDPNFDLSKVTFTPEQWLQAIDKAKKGDCIILDEAMLIMSRSAMSMWNKKVITKLSQIRSKNLFLIFNLPAYFDLDKNIALHRASLLLHCFTPSFRKKGHYKVYFPDEMKLLYIMGKKYYSYKKPVPNFEGFFSSCFVLDQAEYDEKKNKSLSSSEVLVTKTAHQERNLYIKFIRNLDYSYADIAAIDKTGLSADGIGKICRGERGNLIIDNDTGGEKNS